MPRGQRSPGFTQISISIPKTLLEDIDAEAQLDNRSRSNWIVTELTAAVKAHRELRGKDASIEPPGKNPAGGRQRTAGRVKVVEAAMGRDRLTDYQPESPDAPREVKPLVPARAKIHGATPAKKHEHSQSE